MERTLPGRRMFFSPEDTPDVRDPVILSDACKRVLDALLEEGTATASELAASLSLARTGVLRHITTLVDHGFITRHRAGRKVLFLPHETVVHKTVEHPAKKELPRPEHGQDRMVL